MFCPNCGQQQIADSTKFCPRCGTHLAGLAEWLAGGATITVREAPATPAPVVPAPMSPRRRGMRRGAKVMFVSGFLLPFMIAMSIGAENPGPIFISFILFFIGLSMMLYARLFSDAAPRAVGGMAAPLRQMPGATPTAPVLPPAAADNRANTFPRGGGVRTAELSQPPSVTENTTRLLGDE